MTQGLEESPEGGQGEQTPLGKAKEEIFKNLQAVDPFLVRRIGKIANMSDAERILMDIRYDDETLELNLQLEVVLDHTEEKRVAPQGFDVRRETDIADLRGDTLNAVLRSLTWNQRRIIADYLKNTIGIGNLVIHMEQKQQRYDAADILERNLRDLYQRILNPA